jgi:uncharacterized membrane protein YcaP (DUF421 family)
MDPMRIAARAVFVFFVFQALFRVSGKRTVKQGDLASFALTIVIGDLFDDALWAEVPLSEFVVAAAVLLLTHALVSFDAYARGARNWRRALAAEEGGAR